MSLDGLFGMSDREQKVAERIYKCIYVKGRGLRVSGKGNRTVKKTFRITRHRFYEVFGFKIGGESQGVRTQLDVRTSYVTGYLNKRNGND